jgi:colicin import membrane protein
VPKKTHEKKAKVEKLPTTTTSAATEQTTKTSTKAPKLNARKNNQNTNADDKSIGKDAQNRTIYRGPRGGEYYINSAGNKVYTKKDTN